MSSRSVTVGQVRGTAAVDAMVSRAEADPEATMSMVSREPPRCANVRETTVVLNGASCPMNEHGLKLTDPTSELPAATV
jgi:hypothetical protein